MKVTRIIVTCGVDYYSALRWLKEPTICRTCNGMGVKLIAVILIVREKKDSNMKAKFLVPIIVFVLIACSVQSQAQNKQLLKQVKKGNFSKVEKLLQNGADINYKDFLGYSALQFAVIRGHTVIVKLLLEKGANPNIQDILGKTPLMYAIDFNTYYENKMVQIVNLLLQYGADTDIKNKNGLSAIDLALQQSPTDIYILLKPSKIIKEKNILGYVLQPVLSRELIHLLKEIKES